ncbi:MAG TPA: glycosyltransferase family 39 protein [Gemmatimonadaceae bacterium]|nr:glycosyltransferase family 39 protein [Gemmatimonadaceae bacterium]
MFLALLVLLAIGEGLRRTRHRLRALAPALAPGRRRMRGDLTRWLRGVARWEWAALAGALVLALAIRVPDLDQPIRYDEAATWLDYASRPLVEALADYRFPNNHLFHTLLVHVSAAAFGSDPWALRLPAFVAGLLLVPLTWALGRALAGAGAGIAAAALVAASATLALYSTNARGYTIVCCLTVALALLAVHQLRHDEPAGWVLMAAVTALGAWTIPTMLYPALGIGLWAWAAAGRDGAIVDRPAIRARLGWTALGAAGIAALLYLPVVAHSGLALVVGNRFVRPQSRQSFFAALPDFFSALAADWTRGWPMWVAMVVGVAAALGMLSWRAGRDSGVRASPFGAALLAALAFLVLNGRIPYVRVWMYLIPLAAVAAGAALTSIAARLGAGSRTPFIAAAIGAVCGVAGAIGVAGSNAIRRADDTGAMPFAEAVAARLARELAPRDRVIASAPADLPLSYYLRRAGAPGRPLRASADSAGTIWIVVLDDPPQHVDALVRGAEVVRRDFSTPGLVARVDGARVFAMRREQPGCILAPERCR